jgi:hypothetical protein
VPSHGGRRGIAGQDHETTGRTEEHEARSRGLGGRSPRHPRDDVGVRWDPGVGRGHVCSFGTHDGPVAGAQRHRQLCPCKDERVALFDAGSGYSSSTAVPPCHAITQPNGCSGRRRTQQGSRDSHATHRCETGATSDPHPVIGTGADPHSVTGTELSRHNSYVARGESRWAGSDLDAIAYRRSGFVSSFRSFVVGRAASR